MSKIGSPNLAYYIALFVVNKITYPIISHNFTIMQILEINVMF